MLYVDPPPGISAWARESDSRIIDAVLDGADGTPYAGGRFRLQLSCRSYPLSARSSTHHLPPEHRFGWPHLLDILNLPPKGAWKPLNIATVLQSLLPLMAEPNPDDGLMADITHQYIHDRAASSASGRYTAARRARG